MFYETKVKHDSSSSTDSLIVETSIKTLTEHLLNIISLCLCFQQVVLFGPEVGGLVGGRHTPADESVGHTRVPPTSWELWASPQLEPVCPRK